MTISNKNIKYLNTDSSSVYNIKENLNSFLDDFADLDFINVVKNNLFSNIDSRNSLLHWISSGISSNPYNTTLKYLPITLYPSGSITQPIHSELKRDTNYTLTFYGSAAISGTIKVHVYSTNDYQIYNLNDSLEVNSASMYLNATSLGQIQKHVLNFKTTATSGINPPIFVKIENTGSNPILCNFKNILIYGSLIELGNLPSNNDKSNSSGIPSELCFRDFCTNKKYALIALSNTFFKQLISPPFLNQIKDPTTGKYYTMTVTGGTFYLDENVDYTKPINDPVEPKDVLGLKIQADDLNDTFYLRLVNDTFQLEKIENEFINNPTIKDAENGVVYSFHITEPNPNPMLYITTDFYTDSNRVYEDINTGLKYIIVIKNEDILLIETDLYCISDPSPNKNIKDLYNEKSYTITVENGILTFVEIPYNGSYNAVYKLNDYSTGKNYNMTVEYGLKVLYEIE